MITFLKFCFSPQSAAIDSFEMEEGDFIVLGTDGLWDNLNDASLIMLISKIKVVIIFSKIILFLS